MVKTTPTRDSRIDLRLSGEVKASLVKAATYEGVTLSAFMVKAAQKRAKEVIEENEEITLSRKDWEKLYSLIRTGEEPKPMLEAAAKRYLKRKGG